MSAPASGTWLACAVGVSFRIDVTREAGRTTVRLAGRLTAEAVPELLRAIDGELTSAVLDLGDLQSVDPVAGSALVGLRDRGAQLVEASPYVALLVDASARRSDEQ